ncbi:Protein kinase-like domain protein [Cordyceps fumosorosea ARSEF 2679]|uniref:Protein kinase-like domain protein n=1 Tax=Cordyceps fumosorosea (strain ARSEF 2679) TaxID=1081104 RepID=A0A167XIJ8_CORFA|nr:Protein kinase-like domain protein [Cordyceps fumosorosea ARSEF 2679]OAA65015.1 Protein kinase-like domain protein [Cordyceps fumosorosea ARSEF 2679]
MSPESTLVFEGDYAVRKRGFAHLLRMEVEAIYYIKTHAAGPIPVPTIIGFCLDEQSKTIEKVEENYIRMKRVAGHRLDAAWPSMSPAARARTCQQLRAYLELLHRLEPEPGTAQVRAISGGACYNHRKSEPPALRRPLPQPPKASSTSSMPQMMTTTSAAEFRRPFLWRACVDVARFHNALPNHLQARRPEAAEAFRRRFAAAGAEGSGEGGGATGPRRARLTHGDLSWANIFVDEATGDVTGITDWETAGFWPEWWEYYMALLGPRGEQQWWRQVVASIMTEYPVEVGIMAEMEAMVAELGREEPGLMRSRVLYEDGE